MLRGKRLYITDNMKSYQLYTQALPWNAVSQTYILYNNYTVWTWCEMYAVCAWTHHLGRFLWLKAEEAVMHYHHLKGSNWNDASMLTVSNYVTCCSSRVKHLEGHILNIPVHTISKRKALWVMPFGGIIKTKMRKLIWYF